MDVSFLEYAIIELTQVCNLRCLHCYNHWKSGKSTAKVSAHSYRKTFNLLDYLLQHTNVKNIVFTGGEPTLADRFSELVLHAKLNDRKVTLITNGNGPEKIYNQLVSLHIDQCEISIHASNSTIHDRITGISGSWDNAIATLRLMLANKIAVTLIIVVTSINWAYVAKTIRFFYEMGIRHMMVNRYNVGGEGLKHIHLSTTKDELQQVFSEIDQLAEKHSIRIVSGVCTPHCLLNPEDYPHIGFGSCSGNVYQRPLTFDPDGNLRMCNHSPVIAGNIYQQSFEEIFSSDYVNEWDCLDEIDHCSKCPLLSACKGGCRAASEQMGSTLKNADPIIEALGLKYI
nr:radical SAM protein [Parabacteroides goldsteinii]